SGGGGEQPRGYARVEAPAPEGELVEGGAAATLQMAYEREAEGQGLHVSQAQDHDRVAEACDAPDASVVARVGRPQELRRERGVGADGVGELAYVHLRPLHQR